MSLSIDQIKKINKKHTSLWSYEKSAKELTALLKDNSSKTNFSHILQKILYFIWQDEIPTFDVHLLDIKNSRSSFVDFGLFIFNIISTSGFFFIKVCNFFWNRFKYLGWGLHF